ncbi:uncharacterized protein LOC116418458 [Piliocolobus tephrosceles]|uniref:uncharacterized protein LOC116418458 n=1 Tax=Piliocolobus tephrosceles TaxID=591936 RepID=UPI000C2B06B1|nr:uncharacterized protein LOC116418458 [Piliocolobus tephrosceles]
MAMKLSLHSTARSRSVGVKGVTSKQLQNSESKSAVFYVWKLAGLLLRFIEGRQPLTPPFAIGGGCPPQRRSCHLPLREGRLQPLVHSLRSIHSLRSLHSRDRRGRGRVASGRLPHGSAPKPPPWEPGQHLLPHGQAVRTKSRSHSPPGNANESHSEMPPHAHGYSDNRNGARGGAGALSPACRSAQRHASQNWVTVLGIEDRRASQTPGRFRGSSWRAGREEGEGRFHRGNGIWGCEGLCLEATA